MNNTTPARQRCATGVGFAGARLFVGFEGSGFRFSLPKRPQEIPNLFLTVWVAVNSKPRPFQKSKGAATRKFKTASKRAPPAHLKPATWNLQPIP